MSRCACGVGLRMVYRILLSQEGLSFLRTLTTQSSPPLAFKRLNFISSLTVDTAPLFGGYVVYSSVNENYLSSPIYDRT